MASKLFSAAIVGLDCEPVEVECDAGIGQYSFIVVGLPDTAVQESRERIRAAFKNSDLSFPRGKVTVNLAPADIKKEGPSYDLPIALSILFSQKDFTGLIDVSLLEQFLEAVYIGELALDGKVRPVAGVLSVALMARNKSFTSVYVPVVNAKEASLVEGLTVFPVDTLRGLVDHLLGVAPIMPFVRQPNEQLFAYDAGTSIDMAHIKGQEHAKRAIEIAAAGGHNILMSGSPGSGKTMLARTMSTILPPMTIEESLEVTRIYSVGGLLPNDSPLVVKRPFRSPHHTASSVAMVGGGGWPKPGEISLAHRGILFMDEFPEFPRSVLEALRQPLEDGHVSISRSSGTLQFPAKFMLVAAQNPCPCGNFGDALAQCTCTATQILKYQKKISGPLLDRIDLCVDVPRLTISKLTGDTAAESSKEIRERVTRARAAQHKRFNGMSLVCNAEMSSNDVKKFCGVDDSAQSLLKSAVAQFNLSARSYYRILKLARTIADLASDNAIQAGHIAEALQYRAKVST